MAMTINVRDFGAKGDGIDDTLAIQNAIDAAIGSRNPGPRSLQRLQMPLFTSRRGFTSRPRA
jgi:polygalacturonase